ncbi:carboxypeptidase-like regulatory domain-containing protein [Flavitalea sp. BT771]|uniref:carboxypeptidase-like regulatory domain-containing protein n=1 Tax=Flavitalea sp. BT771 TaxID=3063329 RepID=UPI0026E471BE|nr:carboxypeptidase-like regulatory domain-containing protein [Flavitalea sp. BT771]MDO6429223.1 carboxypeptidase-like regulatory domain-containing protein [Flavitalea sp. BT771]MDV6218649.1 carboxypeptidase-like regulatory domain-containing protein [Flavitalea sp. BT771]
MKQTLSLIAFIIGSIFSTWSQSLSGTVMDAITGKPVSGGSVYLNTSSIGAATTESGTFLLKRIPHGKWDLIVSAIGYDTYTLRISSDSLPSELEIRLRQNASELSSLTVEAYLKDGWRQWGKFFLNNFIGTTENASSCQILNKEALRFHYSMKNRKLTVSATAPLIIHNKALGYDLQYQLEAFSYDMKTDVVLYKGYPLFREMSDGEENKRRRWEERRKKAYLGSMHHFVQSLYAGSLAEQGFLVEQTIRIPNAEKERVKKVFDPKAPAGTYPDDSLHYYWRILKQSDQLLQVVRADTAELVKDIPGGSRSLFFPGALYVKYFKDLSTTYDHWLSELRLTTPSPVEIDGSGNYFPAENVLASGYWAQSEKICNLLPLDYPMLAVDPGAKRLPL